ncbi:MAG TPA: hypothetical protein VFJ95_11030, partial [Gammaproteobacteria bacterium]|nr:hypothetical protein [Gammaproteobacteria bacterium]
TDDELKQIPVIPEGQPLQQGAVYVDLRDGRHKEFTARARFAVGSVTVSTGSVTASRACAPRAAQSGVAFERSSSAENISASIWFSRSARQPRSKTFHAPPL